MNTTTNSEPSAWAMAAAREMHVVDLLALVSPSRADQLKAQRIIAALIDRHARGKEQSDPTDTQMLDWLEQQVPDIVDISSTQNVLTLCFEYPQITNDGSESLRDAIRAAMTQEGRK